MTEINHKEIEPIPKLIDFRELPHTEIIEKSIINYLDLNSNSWEIFASCDPSDRALCFAQNVISENITLDPLSAIISYMEKPSKNNFIIFSIAYSILSQIEMDINYFKDDYQIVLDFVEYVFIDSNIDIKKALEVIVTSFVTEFEIPLENLSESSLLLYNE